MPSGAFRVRFLERRCLVAGRPAAVSTCATGEAAASMELTVGTLTPQRWAISIDARFLTRARRVHSATNSSLEIKFPVAKGLGIGLRFRARALTRARHQRIDVATDFFCQSSTHCLLLHLYISIEHAHLTTQWCIGAPHRWSAQGVH